MEHKGSLTYLQFWASDLNPEPREFSQRHPPYFPLISRSS